MSLLAPLTTDVIHVIFTCCDADISSHMTEALNSYYDYLKGYLATHQLDRQNTGLDFDTFWNIIAKTLRAELVEEVRFNNSNIQFNFNIFEAVISPLVILCGQIPEDSILSQDDLWDLFDDLLIEEDVLPLLQMAMYVRPTLSCQNC